MDSYWDLYLAYLDYCVRYNHENDIDPHHYEMEWNHFLPKSIFGDQPLGQWLLKKQHAIASALQTLAFRRNCLFATHKNYLPEPLLQLAWPFYCERSSKTLAKYKASQSFEERQKSSKVANKARSEKLSETERSEIAKIANSVWMANSSFEQRSELIKAGRQKLSQEERSAIIRRGWETRRAKKKIVD